MATIIILEIKIKIINNYYNYTDNYYFLTTIQNSGHCDPDVVALAAAGGGNAAGH